MIRYAVLGSSSKGNAIYFNVDGYQFLIDCGFSQKELDKRLSVFGKTVSDISAVFITHDHGDHRAAWLAKNSMAGWDDYLQASTDVPFIARFPLQHDSESFGYVIGDNSGNRVAVIGDTGCVPEEVLPYLFNCQAILIECNYDVDLLVSGPYSTEQQERIASDHGHLMNEDAAAVIECVAWPGLRHVCALHLSERNNRPEYVRLALENAVRGVRGSGGREGGGEGEKGCEVEISSQKVPGKMVVLI